ncbi:glycosyltransferase [Desulfovermiculus halophilus]|jgi:glycosyltransferase involved in cell wall biosynthesis|uniref:glycosyltransferase n=1 Tax=Desulfovermiculus halophilus TaxID=339722 RepID=UPI0006855893|nr:glycosyltransferase [Desulfovermiculus halophilus]
MKVMHVLSGDLWAGAEVMAINLLQGLQGCAGVELRAVVLNPGRPAREIESLGIPSTVIDENKRSFPGLLFELKKELEAFQPDLVHSHRYKENLLAYLATRGEQKIGLVRTQHGMPEKFGKSFSLKGWAIRQVNFRFLTRCFDCTVAVSDEMKYTMLSDFLSGPGKVVVIHNGVHPPTLASKYKGGEFVIGTCGRLCPVKNYSLFIDMAIRVHQEVPSVRFVLAGDGPEMDVLKERVHGYGLENYFDFLGHMDKMEDFFSRLDVYVNTSLHEGIPLSVLEAMVRGVPVVVLPPTHTGPTHAGF